MSPPPPDPAVSSSTDHAERSPSPRAKPRLLASPAKIIALAVIANLLIAGGVSAAVAPVETSQSALSLYDSLPQGLRSLLGDTQNASGKLDRGPLGSWLDRFHANAVRGDPNAQLGLSLELESEAEPETWTSATSIEVHWTNYGATLTYRLSTSDRPEPPDLQNDPLVETTATNATLPLQPGANWVHLQAAHKDKVGRVATLGPILSDPDPPLQPAGLRIEGDGSPDSTIKVDAYHFTLEWDETEARSGIANYHLERQNAGNWIPVATIEADNQTHTERNRPNGLYAYRVRAESVAGVLSEPSDVLGVRVDAAGSLEPPGVGDWHYGVNAVYHSLIHTWDISDPGLYSSVDEIHSGEAGLSKEEVEHYTGPGWGITLEDPTLRALVAEELGGQWEGDELVGAQKNSLEIGLTLFERMFNDVDYDFDKFSGTDFDLLRANEVLEAGGGICGDLTALFVTLMRIAGVPARPVHGYLINTGATTDQQFDDAIGGFHMWPEIYVGGDATDGPGEGWIPVDVSGVTGPFKPELLHVYFGVSNPNYLQLGVQEDLGDESLPDDHERNKWNVWANLRYQSVDPSSVQVTWDADAKITESEKVLGDLWFDTDTNERVWCETDDEACRGDHTKFFDNVRGRSVRTMDYGATLSWTGDVHDLDLSFRFPVQVGPSQVMMATAYQHDPQCNGSEAPVPGDGEQFIEWNIPGSQEPCSN